MCGNVVEWCLDQYDPDYYKQCSANGGVTEPWNKATKPYPHSVRGGSWDDEADDVPQRRPPRLRPLLEDAGPAVAQEHLVFLRRPMGRLPHRAPAQSAAARK